jgi:hypothetical protein
MDDVSERLAKNLALDTRNYNNPFSLLAIEILYKLEPKDDAMYLIEMLLTDLFSNILANTEFRLRFHSLHILLNLDWLAPLLVLTDYFTYYQDNLIG